MLTLARAEVDGDAAGRPEHREARDQRGGLGAERRHAEAGTDDAADGSRSEDELHRAVPQLGAGRYQDDQRPEQALAAEVLAERRARGALADVAPDDRPPQCHMRGAGDLLADLDARRLTRAPARR